MMAALLRRSGCSPARVLCVLAVALLAAASSSVRAQTCVATTNSCSAAATITTSSVRIGGDGSLSSNGASFSDPGRLDDGTVAGADYDFTFDRSTGTLTLVVTNLTPTTATLTGIGFNATSDVTALTLMSHTGSLPWELAFDSDRTDNVVDSHPSLMELKLDGFGRFSAMLGNNGISTGPAGGNPTELLAGGSITFVMQVTGNLANVTACSLTSVGSVIPPGDKVVVALARFQAGVAGGSGFISPCGSGDLLVSLADFRVVPASGSVTVLWDTASETDTAGFAVIRRNVRTRETERLNTFLVPSQGSPVSGASYAFVDTTAVDGVKYLYQLEDWDFSSVNTLHPPASAVPNPQAPRISLVSPFYESSAGHVVTFTWTADARRRGTLEISPDPAFESGSSLRIHTGTRNTRTLTSRELGMVRAMAEESGESGVYWRVTGQDARGALERSQTFFLTVE